MARARCSKTTKTLPNIRIFDTLFLYDTLKCLGIGAKLLCDQINSKADSDDRQRRLHFLSFLEFAKDKE